MESPQPLWATCATALSLSQQKCEKVQVRSPSLLLPTSSVSTWEATTNSPCLQTPWELTAAHQWQPYAHSAKSHCRDLLEVAGKPPVHT